MPTVTEEANRCPQCGGATRLDEGVCVSCLLRAGLQDKGEASAEIFANVLAQAEMPDTRWQLGNYEILEEIARGGMGVIYRARQRHSRRIVALKRVLAYQADAHETLVRFQREAEMAARLDHPNILPIYEVGESMDGLPFFSMKYASGGSLRAAIPTLRSRPNECVRLMAKIGRAIDYAHQQGVLHRDLHPGNILLDAQGEPLVSDFGLAKWLLAEADLTRTLTTFGTPGYIAPEQAESAASELTPAADVYSLGAILFNLLANRPPFLGTNVLSVIRQTAANPAPKLRSFAPALDRDLETICAHCLERDPKARYQSAGDLAADMERWLEGRPILARPVSLPAQAGRWSRRNPILTGVAVACLSLGAIVLWLLSQRDASPRKLTAPEKSIAVLPFENRSDDKQNAYFADGVQDEILTDLSKIADLKVISRNSTRSYNPNKPRNSREIGQQLGVAHLLEGSVQRSGNRLRVNVQLIDTRSDSHLWAQTYDRQVADVFTIQSEIAQTIANQLHASISADAKAALNRPPTTDLAANDLYVRAIAFEYQDPKQNALVNATNLLEHAIVRDPRFVRAYCALARIHLHLYEGSEHTVSHLQSAKENISKAAQLQSDSGEVHLIQAHYLARCLRDYDAARAELDLARRVLPNDPAVYFETATMDRRQGRWAEALWNFDRAVELDPRNVKYLGTAADSYSSARRYPEATRLAQRALVLSPRDIWLRLFLAQQLVNQRADLRPLRAEVDKILFEDPSALSDVFGKMWECAILEHNVAAADRALSAIPPEGFRGYLGSVEPREWFVGCAARAFNRPKTAHTAFVAARGILEKHLRERPDDAMSWGLLGSVNAMLGERGEAIKAGQRACELWPLSKEPTWGLTVCRRLAVIYASVGENDLALEQLSLHAGQPFFVDYGELKLHPDWDPLRGDPRFEKIVVSLAPKQVASR
jgi:serine/threonine protein kinase